MSIAVGASSRYLSPSWYAGIGIACLILGIALAVAPVVAFALTGLLLGLLLLQLPAYTWVMAAVLTATLSRLFVAVGVPPIVNFFHFPLALGAALIATRESTQPRPIARTIAAGCISLLILALASWVLSGGTLIRPPLTWLVFAEPFLILYALVNGTLSFRHRLFLGRLALVIPFTQLAAALWQTLTLGLSNPDFIQGTFLGMGAGAHVAGAITLIGVSICVARGLSARTFMERVPWLLGVLALFVVPIFSDSKQNIMAFLPALMYLLIASRGQQISSRRAQSTGLVVALPILAFTISAAFIFYPPLQATLDWNRASHGLEGKMDALFSIAKNMSHTLGGWFFGLGPGNSVSRVALMAMEGYIRADSPVAFLGLTMAPTTKAIWDMTFSDAFFSSSSVWSGFSSWFGLIGDLGLAGLLLYLWMCRMIWRELGNTALWQSAVARSVMVMTGFLGGIYSWLEEPGFTFIIALIVGLGLLANADATSALRQSSSLSPGSPRGESGRRQHTGAIQ